MTFRVLSVDDEAPARRKVARLLREDGRCSLIGEACDGVSALEQVEALRPQIVILDVQMPRASGFEVLSALGPVRDFSVIFSTAHESHALRAFESHAVDYLLKPYDHERFRQALDKACVQYVGGRALADASYAAALGASRRLVVQADGDGWLALDYPQILRVRAANKYVALVTREREILVRASLAQLAARLDPSEFVRVHRGELVNLRAVTQVVPCSHGDARIQLSDGSSLTLTRSHRSAFLARYRALEGARGQPQQASKR